MSMAMLGFGATLCVGGAVAHFKESWRQREGGLALVGFCFVLAAMFMSKDGHF